jgi:hypothetical protein
MDFGVFYTCYTEKKAVDYSLEVLYGIYPEVPVYLISDGGEDYSDLGNRYTSRGFNLKTYLEFDSRGLIPTFAHREDFHTEEIQKNVFDSVMAFLERVKRAVDYSGKEFLLVMEPDVLVRGKISNPENHKLLGSRVNTGMSDQIRDVVRSYPGSIDVNNWGITPAIFECSAFLKIYEIIENDRDLLRRLCLSDRRFANYDFMFAILFALVGIPESINSEIVECFRNPNWETTWHPLVHQYRAKYPLSAEGYDGTHIVNKHGMGDQWKWSR